MLFLLAAAQMIAPAPADAERVVIDLTVPTPCANEDEQGLDEEIVVCAAADGRSRYRVPGAQDSPNGQAPPRAELTLPDGTTLAAETESADLGMARSQRLMVRWKLKF